MYVLYFYINDSTVGLYHHHKHVSNALFHDLTTATVSLGERNFSTPLQYYLTTVKNVAHC